MDDTKLNLELMKAMITRWDCHGTFFESGPDAVAFISGAAPADLPDITFMDIHMPLMDGCETTSALLELHPGLTVVGLTADVTPECQAQALGCGMKTLLPKPYREQQLIQACRQHAGPAADQTPSSGFRVQSCSAEIDLSRHLGTPNPIFGTRSRLQGSPGGASTPSWCLASL